MKWTKQRIRDIRSSIIEGEYMTDEQLEMLNDFNIEIPEVSRRLTRRERIKRIQDKIDGVLRSKKIRRRIG